MRMATTTLCYFDNEEVENVFVEDNGKCIGGLVDGRNKVEALPKNTHKKTGRISRKWSMRMPIAKRVNDCRVIVISLLKDDGDNSVAQIRLADGTKNLKFSSAIQKPEWKTHCRIPITLSLHITNHESIQKRDGMISRERKKREVRDERSELERKDEKKGYK
ncbi:hypothetical protein Tco_0174505 [Tanacetum coccineum]